MNNIVEYNKTLYIRHLYIINNLGIKRSNVYKWLNRNIEHIVKEGVIYIKYDSIPESTLQKLPTKESLISINTAQLSDNITTTYFKKMQDAYVKEFGKYRLIYEDKVTPEKMLDCARKHAVWTAVLQLHASESVPKLRNIWEAYDRIYPKHYVYNRMNAAIKKAKTEGIESLLIPKYRNYEKKLDPVILKWVLDLSTSGKFYSHVYVHEVVCQLCDEYNLPRPSLTWIRNSRKGLSKIITTNKDADKDTFGRLPYCGIIPAQYTGDQWQIDGWALPFFNPTWDRPTLFAVIDASSRKIIGYKVGEKENTELILAGLKDAIIKTGMLPYEIVSDNHSFNQTEAADIFKTAIKTIGTTWTVTQNPRHKALIERMFRTLGEKFCKKEFGYIGSGIKSKSENARTSQELTDKYRKEKEYFTNDHITAIAVKVVDEYNRTAGKDGKSPNQRYDESKKKNAIPTDEKMMLRLFGTTGEYTIRNGQFSIRNGAGNIEYQINAQMHTQLNNEKVRVRWHEYDKVHLFDLKTDCYIGVAQRKQYAHGALANQTEADILKFNKNKGRIEGIKNDRKKRQIDIAAEAAKAHPEAYLSMNEKSTPKQVRKTFERSAYLRDELARNGVNLDTLTDIPEVCEVKSYNPDTETKAERRRREHPFSPKNHVFREIKDTDTI